MLIDRVMSFCDSEYRNAHRNTRCEDCLHTQVIAPEIVKTALKKFIIHHGIRTERNFTIVLI